MSSPERRPSADELDRLIEQVRRDPGSRAFVQLGEAYLALGRARDAVEVGVSGLKVQPDHSDGRVLVARALCALHQWKEAQAELLKVVKTDRSHKGAFSLLGEVLLRRGDFERGLQILQHAQNLDPSNPTVLSLLRRARAGQQLDPPPPIPTPVEPARSGGAPPPRAKPRPSAPPPPPRPAPPPRAETDLDDAPTSIGGPTLRDDPTDVNTRGPGGNEVTGEIEEEPAPPPPPPRAKPRPSAPPPAEVVRPRIISQAKPPNPAAAALRESAAAGENFLNDLLTGGLLDVPGVRVPDSEYDIKPDRRWGRSGGKALVALFVLLVLGAGGGVTWWYVSEQQKAAAVKADREAAAKVFVTGSFDDLKAAALKLADALDRDHDNARIFADAAEITALQALLYGIEERKTDAQDSIKQAERDITKPDQDGYHQLVIARAALALSKLDQPDATASLATARSAIEEYLATNSDDHWAQWLLGKAMLDQGERTSAKATFQAAAQGDDGIVPAMIDLADLTADDGDLEGATKLYDRALAASPDHPLALVGEVLAWAERGVEQSKTLELLNVQLGEKKLFGPRVRAYRQLALALAKYQIEDYDEFAKDLAATAAGLPHEARYLGRVALAHLLGGDFAEAAKARAQVAYFGKGKPEADPVVDVFDAALLVESGLPQRALDVLGANKSTRAHLIRAQAYLDLGQDDKALDEAQQAKDSAPDNLEAQALLIWAQVLTAPASKRDDLVRGDLNAIANKMVSKRGRHVEGAALFAIGASEARGKLEEALDGVDSANPNPISYRTHTLLARLDLSTFLADAANKPEALTAAQTHIDAALAANGGYLPAMVVQARIKLASGDTDGALAALAPVLAQREAITAEAELAHAEALAAQKTPDKEGARAALDHATKLGAPSTEVARVAALIDPAALDAPAPTPAPRPRGRHPRGSR